MQRRIAEYLMVGRHRHMRTHAAYRIAQGSAILNFQPFHRVTVVTDPALGRIVEHPRIEPPAAAGTGLKEYLREFCRQPVIQIVHSQYIPVVDLSLPVRRPACRIAFRDAAVHIPFDIRNFRFP